MKYGKHTDLVEAFLTHLKSGDVDWDAADAARNAARAASWAASRTAACDAAAGVAGLVAACYATYEIIGHEVLAEQGKPLVFLPMFGIESIGQLKEMNDG